MITGVGHDPKRDTWFFFGDVMNRITGAPWSQRFPSLVSVLYVWSLLDLWFILFLCYFHPSSRRRLLFLCPAVFHSLVLLYPDIPPASFTDLRPHRLAGSTTGGVILKKFILSC